jgi:hypothetical protein
LALTDPIKASPYIINAIKYKDRKPKYIALYSRNPPSIDPSKFEERAAATEVFLLSSVEKINPEKNKGSVSTIGIIALLRAGANTLKLVKVKPKPRTKDKKIDPYATKGEILPALIASRLAKNAIIRIKVITILITTQVLPYTRASSVMLFVSMSIKPAPKKKHGIEKPPAEPEAS